MRGAGVLCAVHCGAVVYIIYNIKGILARARMCKSRVNKEDGDGEFAGGRRWTVAVRTGKYCCAVLRYVIYRYNTRARCAEDKTSV